MLPRRCHSVDQATFELYMAGEQGTPAAVACLTAPPAAHEMLDALAGMESARMVPESMAAATPYVQNGLVPSPCGAWPEQPLVFSADCGFCSSNGDLPSPRHAAASNAAASADIEGSCLHESKFVRLRQGTGSSSTEPTGTARASLHQPAASQASSGSKAAECLPSLHSNSTPRPCGAWPDQPLEFSADCGICCSTSQQSTASASNTAESSHEGSSCRQHVGSPKSVLAWDQAEQDASVNGDKPVLALQPVIEQLSSGSLLSTERPQGCSSPSREQGEQQLPCPTICMGTWLGLAAGGAYLSAAIPAGIAVGTCMVIRELCAAVSDRLIPSTLPQIAHSR